MAGMNKPWARSIKMTSFLETAVNGDGDNNKSYPKKLLQKYWNGFGNVMSNFSMYQSNARYIIWWAIIWHNLRYIIWWAFMKRAKAPRTPAPIISLLASDFSFHSFRKELYTVQMHFLRHGVQENLDNLY